MTPDRTVWMISAIIEATEEDAQAAEEAIERALCPDPDHPGYCPVPWTTIAVRFADLDPDEREAWQADFDDDRRRARDVGEPAERVSDRGSCLHFSLANPRADGATDLPRLLRRLADAIAERGIDPMNILDVTVSHEITEDGPWWSGTVYWSPESKPSQEQ